MIKVTVKQQSNKANKFFEKLLNVAKLGSLDKYGRMGVECLTRSTPLDTGKTASSWSYEIERTGQRVSLIWKNDNVNDGVNVAVVLQYGHASRNGSWVEGIDYINPALRPVFDKMANDLWGEVTSS